MVHTPYVRIAENSRKAVLLIHGIVGTPAHFRDLIPVIPEDWSVYNILLDGHGKGVRDFGATSMAKWKAQVSDTLDEIFARHDQVVLVAHSMGTLFSIQAAIDHPDKIRRLFLLAVPIRPWVRFSTALTSLRVTRKHIRPEDTAAMAMLNACSVQLEPQLWKYLPWAPRFIELLAEASRVRKLLPQLQVPCQTFQSWVDELVSARSCKDLEGHPYIQNTILYDSGHFAYGKADMQLLQRQLSDTLRSLM